MPRQASGSAQLAKAWTADPPSGMQRYMSPKDANSLFAQAEQAFSQGRFDEAHTLLSRLQKYVPGNAAIIHLLALVQRKRGQLHASQTAFLEALKLAPAEAEINNNYANLLVSLGDDPQALGYYDRSIGAKPNFVEARFNRSLLLQRSGAVREALQEVDALLADRPKDARFQAARGTMLRDLGRSDDAVHAFDAALALDPMRKVAAHGRARCALERGEPEAVSHHRRALSLDPQNPDLHLGLASALEADGLAAEAMAALARFVAAHPRHSQAQSFLAHLHWENGNTDEFTVALEDAVQRYPDDRALSRALIAAYAGADMPDAAASAASKADAAFNGDPEFRLLEALYASEAGDVATADRLFAMLPDTLADLPTRQALHELRAGRIDKAGGLLDQARLGGGSVEAWALTGLVWRLTGDARTDWLHRENDLIRSKALELGKDTLLELAQRLRTLHRTRAHPLGQSLRGGTQTRGRLLDRTDPEIRELYGALQNSVERYWAQLPAFDRQHPLLRHRDLSARFGGSWSVRLMDGGFHVAHFHPQGVLSSAAYIVLPRDQEPLEGWLEVGGPPANLSLDLAPLRQIEPVAGSIALFPSYLFHGTRPFRAGERLTVAFDVVTA